MVPTSITKRHSPPAWTKRRFHERFRKRIWNHDAPGPDREMEHAARQDACRMEAALDDVYGRRAWLRHPGLTEPAPADGPSDPSTGSSASVRLSVRPSVRHEHVIDDV